jgi:hypothetical protein
LIIGLAGIGAFAALGATNVVSGAEAAAGISAFGAFGLGTSAVAVGVNAGQTASAASAPTPPA